MCLWFRGRPIKNRSRHQGADIRHERRQVLFVADGRDRGVPPEEKDGNVYDYAVYTRSPGFKVVLGTTEDLDVKLDNFRVIYSYLYDQNRTGDYKVVNLEFVNYLICQKK